MRQKDRFPRRADINRRYQSANKVRDVDEHESRSWSAHERQDAVLR
jgi:hypothetical protein